jgi:hypothetical protein
MKIRIWILLICFFFGLEGLHAQGIQENASSKKTATNKLIIPMNASVWAGYTQLNQPAIEYGASISYMFWHKLNLGICMAGIEDKFSSKLIEHHSSDEQFFLRAFYGGLFIEPVFFSNSVVHFSIPTVLGCGNVTGHQIYNLYSERDPPMVHWGHEKNHSVFWVFEPGLDAEFVLSKHFRMGAGIRYRLVSNLNFTTLSGVFEKSVLRKFPTFSLSCKFGNF